MMHLATMLSISLWSQWSRALDGNSDRRTSSGYEVASLPDAPTLPTLSHAGLMPVLPAQNTSLFFWQFASSLTTSANRTFIWFNGGPGCSSSTGSLLEIGPYRVQSDGTLVHNAGSWTEIGNLLFIDNPIGTGYSFTRPGLLATELDEVAAYIVAFLENYFDVFPHYANDSIYLAGESFAGQYIPYIARAMQSRNHGKMHKWRLSGLIIGNGWIDGQTQYPAYLEYAIANNLIPNRALETIRQKQRACLRELVDGGKDHVHSPSCSSMIGDILKVSQHDGQCFNMYDIRKWDEFPRCGMGFPPELPNLSAYMQRKDVMEMLHVDSSLGRWEECRSDVGAAFTTQNSLPASRLLPELISEMPVLLYAGDKDFACNHLGLERFVESLGWDDSIEPYSMRDQDPSLAAWTIDDRTIGQWYSKNNLTYVRHYNASHMVPYDHPQQVKQMVGRFLEESLRAAASLSSTYVESESHVTIHSDQEADANHWAWMLFGTSVLVVGFMLVVAMATCPGL